MNLTTETPANTTGVSVTTAGTDVYLYVYIAVRMILSLLALGGNSLTIAAVVKFEYIRSPSNRLIASLALADWINGLNVFFLLTTYLVEGTRYWTGICLTGEILNMMGAAGNIYTICIVAVERYLFISHPYSYERWVTEKSSTVAATCVWAWIAISVPGPAAIFNRLKPGMPCRFGVFTPPWLMLGVHMTQVTVYTAIVIVLYVRIATLAWKHSRQIAAVGMNAERVISQAQRKITKMMILVVGVYLMAVVPPSIVQITSSLTQTPVNYFLDRISVLIWWTNCWANPLIYAWKSPDMRHAFKLLLRIPVNTTTWPSLTVHTNDINPASMGNAAPAAQAASHPSPPPSAEPEQNDQRSEPA